MNGIDVAILGATGTVGEAMLSILADRKFPIANMYPLASSKSTEDIVIFNHRPLQVIDAEKFDFNKVQLAFFSAGAAASQHLISRAQAAGCVVIDNTSAFRYMEEVPLVIPEINAAAIANYKNFGVIANPNCTVIQMLVALWPIYKYAGIKRIDVATYQAVSGSGRRAINELAKQTAALLNAKSIETEAYSCQIAFNVIPQIDELQANGFTKEEMKMLWETHKILADDSIIVNATNVRVPVFFGHAAAVHLELRDPLDASLAKEILTASGDMLVVADNDALNHPTPVTHASGTDQIYVGRIRNGVDENSLLNMWIVSDNIRKGAALNSIQIAEILVNQYF